jgi:Rhomboid family
MSIAAIILVVTLATSLAALYGSPKIIESSLFRPYWFLRRRQYATIVTSGLVHADLPHLIFNLITFYFFAFQLEKQIGGARFAALYLIGLVVSDAGTYFKRPCCSRRSSTFPGRSSSSSRFLCRSRHRSSRSVTSPTRGIRPGMHVGASITMRILAARWPAWRLLRSRIPARIGSCCSGPPADSAN